MNRKLKMGMVGGGRGAFIGAVHRMASQMDGKIELACGAFSSVRRKSEESGADLLLPPSRVYGNYREMIRREAKRPLGERMDFVTIVTPNDMHYPVAMAALDSGFPVVSDKPITLNMDEARNLERKVRSTGQLFCVTYNYTGYPMVKEARALVKSGALGKIRRVVVEYPQGWLNTRLEATGQKQAAWRTDPARIGATGCIGDIGSHCENLASYITDSEIVDLCADMNIFVKGRPVDDDGSILLRFKNGAHGVLWASQIAVGEENALNIRVYGETGGLEWHQQEPNTLLVHRPDKPTEVRRTATGSIGPAAAAFARLPAGHVEGYIEAFANVYRTFTQALTDSLEGKKVREADYDFPNIQDGVRGMAFLTAAVKSMTAKEKWVKVAKH
jgi:predicted dehydrogenase